MSSAKKTFAPKTFACNSFANGNWRGSGVDVTTPANYSGKVGLRPLYSGRVGLREYMAGKVRLRG